MDRIEDTPLALALACAVPLLIFDLEALGGPGVEDLERAQAYGERLCGPDGADVIFRGKHTPEMFNGLARSIAVLAFCPGGCRIFGQHFEGKRP